MTERPASADRDLEKSELELAVAAERPAYIESSPDKLLGDLPIARAEVTQAHDIAHRNAQKLFELQEAHAKITSELCSRLEAQIEARRVAEERIYTLDIELLRAQVALEGAISHSASLEKRLSEKTTADRSIA